MSESSVQSKIIGYLSYNNYWCERTNSGSAFIKFGQATKRIQLCRKGCPDVIALVNGIFIGIEIKKDKKEYEKWKRIATSYRKTKEIKKSWQHVIDQYNYGMEIIASGGEYIVTYSQAHLHEQIERLKNKYLK